MNRRLKVGVAVPKAFGRTYDLPDLHRDAIAQGVYFHKKSPRRIEGSKSGWQSRKLSGEPTTFPIYIGTR
ncbi:hypothetical protein [Algoriphagus namhaensis]